MWASARWLTRHNTLSSQTIEHFIKFRIIWAVGKSIVARGMLQWTAYSWNGDFRINTPIDEALSPPEKPTVCSALHMASAHFLSVFRNWKSTFQLALEILQNLQKVNNPCHVGSSQCEKRRVFCCQGAILLYCPLLSWIGGSAVFVQCFCSGFFNIHLSLSCQQGRKVCSTILPIAMDTGLINPEMGRFQRSPGIYLDWIQHMFQHI